jgi:hypothetical protein
MRMSWREMERRAGCGRDTLRQFATGEAQPSMLTRLRLSANGWSLNGFSNLELRKWRIEGITLQEWNLLFETDFQSELHKSLHPLMGCGEFAMLDHVTRGEAKVLIQSVEEEFPYGEEPRVFFGIVLDGLPIDQYGRVA